MPIFLLLAETTWTWQFAAKQLEPWVHMVAVEEVLIERARSAFLVHWFGMRLPLRSCQPLYIAQLSRHISLTQPRNLSRQTLWRFTPIHG